jgi:hypothetical protein
MVQNMNRPVTELRKYERDIDILLAEEFSVSSTFADWFLSKSKFAGRSGHVIHVFVSKANNLGESDLVVVYSLDRGGRIALLIEDKVDAELQPQQADRYRQRADREVKAGAFGDYEVILCAPRAYPAPHLEVAAFDRFVSYEEIGEWLAHNDPSHRGQYRADFIRMAAARPLNGWTRVQDHATDEWRDAVYLMASQDFPILEMKPGRVTKGNSWFVFRPRDMPTKPKHVYIEVSPKGRVKLVFGSTSGHQFRQFRDAIQPLLIDGMKIDEFGGSAAIWVTTPAFKVEDGLETGLPKVRKAFEASERLIKFYRTHRQALHAAASAATPPVTPPFSTGMGTVQL